MPTLPKVVIDIVVPQIWPQFDINCTKIEFSPFDNYMVFIVRLCMNCYA
jgi:hypothetical protein